MEDSTNTRPDIVSELNDWNAGLSEQTAIGWDKIPDIELYMDQVVTFLERQMKMYRRSEDDKVITPSMINNYTKDRVIPRAKSKKYSKDHIAMIMVLCSLKKVLSMPDLTNMFKDFKVNEDEQIKQFYEMYREYQSQAIKNTTTIIAHSINQHGTSHKDEFDKTVEKENPTEADKEQKRALLKSLALRLAVEAQIKSAAAEQILDLASRP